MTHTPGPWRRGEGQAEIISNGEVVALCTSNDANARLIAAAPKMKTALQYLVVFLSVLNTVKGSGHTLVTKEAALAKIGEALALTEGFEPTMGPEDSA